MKKLLVVALLAALSPLGAFAADTVTTTPDVTAPAAPSTEKRLFDPIALPGYTWGGITYPNSVIRGTPDNNDVVLQGKLEQGADWFKFGERKEFTFNTFVNVNYTLDSQGVPWNNKVLPAIGAKVRVDSDWGTADFGVQYVYQDQWKNPSGYTTGNGVQLFVDWYSGWNLKK